jgi:hypothetical protein
MHPITRAKLAELFDLLKFTPTPEQINEFAGDLCKLNQPLLTETLLSIIESKGLAQDLPRHNRRLVLSVYHRKIKEITGLSAYLFVFESALRATAATEIEQHHNAVKWWHPIEAVLREGNRPKVVKGFTPEQCSEIAFALWKIDGDPASKFVLNKTTMAHCPDGSHFLSRTDITVLGRLILTYWGACFKGYYNPGGRLAVTKDNFHDQFKLIVAARNSAYHHNPVTGHQNVLKAIRNRLSYLGIDADEEVASSAAAV